MINELGSFAFNPNNKMMVKANGGSKKQIIISQLPLLEDKNFNLENKIYEDKLQNPKENFFNGHKAKLCKDENTTLDLEKLMDL